MKAPSFREVASAAGVSASTASRALNGNAQVDEKLSERVRTIADRMGYRKNALISSVMRDFRSAHSQVHRGTLRLLCCDVPGDWKPGGKAPFIEPLLDGVRARAGAQGYNVETFLIDHPEAMPARRLVQILTSRGITGLLLPTASTLRHEIAFPWSKFATVAMGSFYFRPRLHRVGRDFYRDVHATVENLLLHGYRRIGFATFESEAQRQDHMGIAAFNQTTAQLPSKRRIAPYCASSPNAKDFIRWTKNNRPDAVMCEIPQGYDWLLEAGYQMPADLGFVGLSITRSTKHEITGLLIPYHEIGCAAVDLLTKLIEQREIGVPERSRAVQVRSEWHDGTTLKKMTGYKKSPRSQPRRSQSNGGRLTRATDSAAEPQMARS